MPYVYTKAASLNGKEKVGTHECVALVQHFAPVGSTRTWVAGARVMDSRNVVAGTAIATFRNGKYANVDTNNHAAFFLNYEVNGIAVVDQWRDKPHAKKRNIKRRVILARGGPYKDGTWPQESDNADAFFVIEKAVPRPQRQATSK